MTDIIVMGILVLIIGAAITYIVKAKKKGAKCIGCPASGNCPSKSAGKSTCSCSCQSDTEEK